MGDILLRGGRKGRGFTSKGDAWNGRKERGDVEAKEGKYANVKVCKMNTACRFS